MNDVSEYAIPVVSTGPVATRSGSRRLPTTLGYKVRRLQMAYKRKFSELGENSTFQLHDAGVFSLIARNPGITPTELADTLNVNAAQVSKSLKLMDATGMLLREKSVSDSRSHSLSLSDAGKLEFERLRALVMAVEAWVVGDVLSDAEKAALFDMLDRIEKIGPRTQLTDWRGHAIKSPEREG